MDSIKGKLLYEIVGLSGEPVTAPYQSRRSLDASIEIGKKFDPHYSEKFRVKVMRVEFVGFEDIEPLAILADEENQLERLCEDCESPDHVEGSERCEVSYPKGGFDAEMEGEN